MAQLSIFPIQSGAELRDHGIKKAIDHADHIHEKWSEKAYQSLIKFLKTCPPSFMAEDVRSFAKGLPDPPHNRAWGGVMLRAVKAGIIKRAGYSAVSNPKAHMAMASIWEKVY